MLSKQNKKEAENLINQGLTALQIFEETGNRIQFVAFLDQSKKFVRENKGVLSQTLIGELKPEN